MRLSELTPDYIAEATRALADESVAMRATLAPDAAWQPIETAPRDGALIIVRYLGDEGDDEPHRAFARWSEDRRSSISPGYDGYQGPGWEDYDFGWVDYESRGITGWRPVSGPDAEAREAADTDETEGR